MNDIVRRETNERLSRIVIHGDTVYIAGVTSTAEGGIEAQTRDVLAKIDGYLKQAKTDKSRLLSVQIWLKDIARDFAGMNAVWAEWALPRAMPTRATCEAKLASPDMLVEIIVTAAARPAYVSGPTSES
ncbi:RidA family protein [Achromobacter mucicolens]|uniref:RidA family protein n=1 Tax=Achromobacter mucicolens TaxID=1389922 RepID=UPI00244A0FA0|nr:RidA family protein [Achromobacter mucicolens]MDH0093632.1 RidA family protein [Achromobacter mucicolens]